MTSDPLPRRNDGWGSSGRSTPPVSGRISWRLLGGANSLSFPRGAWERGHGPSPGRFALKACRVRREVSLSSLGSRRLRRGGFSPKIGIGELRPHDRTEQPSPPPQTCPIEVSNPEG